MSRQNKVNPGMYTQRGRLTQDDAARELRKQRSIGSEHTWQPVKKDIFSRLESRDASNRGTQTTEDSERRKPKAAPVKAKAAKARTATTRTAKAKTARKTTAKAKTRKPSKPAAKARAAKTGRKAVLARNVGGGGPKPRQAVKRRKS